MTKKQMQHHLKKLECFRKLSNLGYKVYLRDKYLLFIKENIISFRVIKFYFESKLYEIPSLVIDNIELSLITKYVFHFEKSRGNN